MIPPEALILRRVSLPYPGVGRVYIFGQTGYSSMDGGRSSTNYVYKEKRMSTLQARLGFNDPDLKTQAHDLIMLWLDQNMKEVFRPFIEALKKSDRRIGCYPSQVPAELPPIPDGMTSSIWAKKTWEYPVQRGYDSRNLYTVGFVDMCIKIYNRLPVLHANNGVHWELEDDYITSFYIEVKSKIPSLGEVIRQIRLYESYLPKGWFFVVSPDDRFRSAIEDQDIKFIAVPPEVLVG